MLQFEADRWLDIDEQENLIGTTVMWLRERETISEFFEITMMAVVMGFLAAAYLATLSGPNVYELKLMAAGLLILGGGLAYFGRRICLSRRELTFYDNGVFAVQRHWLLWRFIGPRVLGDHRRIKTIQIQQEELADDDPQRSQPNRCRRYEVWFYFTDGNSMNVVGNLIKREAHHLSVLFEQALKELQDAQAQTAFNNGVAWADVEVD